MAKPLPRSPINPRAGAEELDQVDFARVADPYEAATSRAFLALARQLERAGEPIEADSDSAWVKALRGTIAQAHNRPLDRRAAVKLAEDIGATCVAWLVHLQRRGAKVPS